METPETGSRGEGEGLLGYPVTCAHTACARWSLEPTTLKEVRETAALLFIHIHVIMSCLTRSRFLLIRVRTALIAEVYSLKVTTTPTSRSYKGLTITRTHFLVVVVMRHVARRASGSIALTLYAIISW